MTRIHQPSKLELLALEVALQAPVKKNPFVFQAYIPWSVVNDIREELTRMGVDWQKHSRIHHQRKAEARRVAQ